MSAPSQPARRHDPQRQRAARLLLDVALVVAAIVLVLARPTKPAIPTLQPSGRREREHSPSRRSARLAPRTRSTAETFLEGFLKYLYGRAPARGVKGTTVAFLRSLEEQDLRVPPGMRSLHPRIVSLDAVPAPQAGSVVATALISDEEDVDYRIAVDLASSRGRELVTGVQQR
jgi:hypothetical protein